MIFDKTLVEKRMAEERSQRSQLKFESFTKKKIQELQRYISNFEEAEPPREPVRGFGHTLSGHPATLEVGFESIDKAKEIISALRLENKIMKETIEALKLKTEETQARFEADLKRVEGIHSQLLENTRAELSQGLEQKSRQIAELVESKRYLSEQLEALGNKYAQLDQTAFEKMEGMKARFQEELKRARAEWEAQSTIKFKDWKEKTRRQLKETTIKGLEPEIDRILKKGETEKEKLRGYYEDLLKSQEEGTQRRVQELLQKEKEKMVAENSIFNEKQRAILVEGFEKEIQVLKKTHELEIASNAKIFEREKSAIDGLKSVEAASLKERLDKATRELREARATAEEKLRAVQADSQIKLLEQKSALQKENATALADLREKLEAKTEETVRARTAKLREDLEKKQREEIEMLISRFAEEASARECHKCTAPGRPSLARPDQPQDTGLRGRLAEVEQERDYLKQKVVLLTNKVESIKAEKLEAENESFGLRETLEGLQSERTSLRTRLSALEDQLKTVYASVEDKAKENSRLKSEIYELKSQFESLKLSSEHSLKAYYEQELEAQQRRFDGELDSIQKKITEVMEARDRTIAELRKEADFKNSIIRKYEEVLEKQRNDFLSK